MPDIMSRNGLIRRHPPRTLKEVLGGVLSAAMFLGAGFGPVAYAQANKAAPRAAGPGMNGRLMQGQPRPAQGQGGSQRPMQQNGGLVNGNRPGQAQQHLSQWMEAHRNMPLAQQQSALEAEPGFHQLKPQEQERMRNQLTRLNTMPAEQRQRTIARTEWMEHLAPQQRQQVRNAMAQLGSLPPERARAVGRAFRSLESLPEPQRQMYLNSPQVHAQFNDQERGTLNNLLSVAPLIPPAPQQTPR